MQNTKLLIATKVTLLAALLTACQTTPAIPEYDGAMLYQGYCASCHGPTGRGDGPIAPSLNVGMQDLRTIAARNGGSFPEILIETIIDGTRERPAHGTPGMPVWGWAFYTAEAKMGETEPEKFADARIRALTDYLESIQIDL